MYTRSDGTPTLYRLPSTKRDTVLCVKSWCFFDPSKPVDCPGNRYPPIRTYFAPTVAAHPIAAERYDSLISSTSQHSKFVAQIYLIHEQCHSRYASHKRCVQIQKFFPPSFRLFFLTSRWTTRFAILFRRRINLVLVILFVLTAIWFGFTYRRLGFPFPRWHGRTGLPIVTVTVRLIVVVCAQFDVKKCNEKNFFDRMKWARPLPLLHQLGFSGADRASSTSS